MKRILCYGDSNTWGWDGERNGRFDEEHRWTRLLAKKLGPEYEIIEEGLCGRTTVFDDPINIGMNGIKYLTPCLQSQGPFDTMILMLGTNDCKERFSATPKNIADGLVLLIRQAKAQGIYVWKEEPDILVVAPTPVRAGVETSFVSGEMGKDSVRKSEELGAVYKAAAEMNGCRFLDARECTCNEVDFMHLDEAGHQRLADMLAPLVK